jgi:predicted TIM-barrel fold metal-dependent hydrolase
MAARENRVPVLVDVTGQSHIGASGMTGAPSSRWWTSSSGYPNVYSDTSGVRRFDCLVEAVRKAGPGKLLFGTDGPWPPGWSWRRSVCFAVGALS